MADGVRRSDAANPGRPGVAEGAPETPAHRGGGGRPVGDPRDPRDGRDGRDPRDGRSPGSYPNQGSHQAQGPYRDPGSYQDQGRYQDPAAHREPGGYPTGTAAQYPSGGYPPDGGYQTPRPHQGTGRAPSSRYAQNGGAPQAGYGRGDHSAGYGNNAGRRTGPAPGRDGGYRPAAGYPPEADATRNGALDDFYDEETRYGPGSAPATPADPGSRRGEEHRTAAPRPGGAARPPQAYPPTASHPPQGGQYRTGGTYPREDTAYPDDGRPPARPAQQGEVTGRRPPQPASPSRPAPTRRGESPQTEVFAPDARTVVPGARRPREAEDRPGGGVAPPRTTRTRTDPPGTGAGTAARRPGAGTARRPGAQRPTAAHSGPQRPARAEQAVRPPASGKIDDSPSERRRAGDRRGDDRADRSSGDDDTGSHRRQTRDAGVGPLLRRLFFTVLLLGVAFVVGVGAAFVWQMISPSGAGTGARSSAAPKSTAAAPGGATPTASASQGTGGTTGPATVPADWVAYADVQQRAKFSHPPTWKLRRDSTGTFFGEAAVGTATAGPQMVGVARVAGSDPQSALNAVQNSEFASQPGLTRERSGPVADSAGAQVQELVGSYLREGQQVTYVMRAIPAGSAVYVLISRSSSAAAGTATTLIESLRASFNPAS